MWRSARSFPTSASGSLGETVMISGDMISPTVISFRDSSSTTSHSPSPPSPVPPFSSFAELGIGVAVESARLFGRALEARHVAHNVEERHHAHRVAPAIGDERAADAVFAQDARGFLQSRVDVQREDGTRHHVLGHHLLSILHK